MTEVQTRATVTRAALLDAAQDVFGRNGYDGASVTEIVDRARSSVGSMYHHFGGKAELWLALYRAHQSRLQHHSAAAYRDAVSAGQGDAFELFLIGCRAYIDACWRERKLTVLFAEGDAPPGFEVASREVFSHWLQTNTAQLSDQRNPLSPTLVLALTTLARTAGREVAHRRTRATAAAFADEFLEIMRRLSP